MRCGEAQVFKTVAIGAFAAVASAMALAHLGVFHRVVDIDIKDAGIAPVLPDFSWRFMPYHRRFAQQAAGGVGAAADQVGGQIGNPVVGEKVIGRFADHACCAENEAGESERDQEQAGDKSRRGVLLPLLPESYRPLRPAACGLLP